MRYYDQRGIEAVGSGLITMRRRQGENWFRADDAPEDMAYPCGDDILRAFEVGNALRALPADEALLAWRLQLASDVRLVQEWAPSASGWSVARAHVHRTTGLQYRGDIDVHGAQILAGCNGERPLGELLEATAAALGADVGAVEARALPVVRRMVEQGFLSPVTGGAGR
jgi:hypothetical protein